MKTNSQETKNLNEPYHKKSGCTACMHNNDSDQLAYIQRPIYSEMHSPQRICIWTVKICRMIPIFIIHMCHKPYFLVALFI